MKNTPVLAFDCACAGAGISLAAHSSTRSHQLDQGKQAATLVAAIDALMAEAGLDYADLGCIVTTTGPGSFTGLRIGLAALHGLVLVNRTPIKTLTTLEAMAWHIARMPNAPARFTVAIRAGKGELYTQEFEAKSQIPAARGEIILLPETFDDWASPCFGNQLTPTDANYLAAPNTETLCAIAALLPDSRLADALPLYIRPPDAIIPAAPAWLS